MPFIYLFINLTQEYDPNVRYISDLFNEFVNVYVVDGSSLTTVKAKNDVGRIHLINETFQELKSFKPHFLENKYKSTHWDSSYATCI